MSDGGIGNKRVYFTAGTMTCFIHLLFVKLNLCSVYRVSADFTITCQACGASCVCYGAEHCGEGADGVQSGTRILSEPLNLNVSFFLLYCFHHVGKTAAVILVTHQLHYLFFWRKCPHLGF